MAICQNVRYNDSHCIFYVTPFFSRGRNRSHPQFKPTANKKLKANVSFYFFIFKATFLMCVSVQKTALWGQSSHWKA